MDDQDETWARASRSFSQSYSTDFKGEVQASDIPSVSHQAMELSISWLAYTELATDFSQRELMVAHRGQRETSDRREKKGEGTAENPVLSKYRFDIPPHGGYSMVAVIDNVPLRVKVARSLEWASEIPPGNRRQLGMRLDTMVACLETKHKVPIPIAGVTIRNFATQRKVAMCGKLTRIINICCMAPAFSRAFNYATWDTYLGDLETNFISWYPEDTGKLECGSNTSLWG